MSKVFQVIDGLFFAYYPEYKTSFEAKKFYDDSVIFVDAPDFVFPGWHYDGEKIGNDRFLRPEPPEGMLYDDKTGQFYPEHGLSPSERMDRQALLEEQLKAASKQNEFLEDCIAEMAAQVYGEQEVK